MSKDHTPGVKGARMEHGDVKYLYGVERDGVITYSTVSHGEAAILNELAKARAELAATNALLDATYKALNGE